ncbi:MAG TPA: lysophospholipid acyltransferase family protein, partial [Gammaproteobacteria bacterium]|nr:lysophospholipid acyltransferase family protein [Gammaproteobacteria bacterium]
MTAEQRPGTGSRIPIKLFSLYLRAYFLRHFAALRLSRACPLPDIGANTVLYANHPSWWDPVVMLLFAAGPLARFRLFAPIEAAALARYPILRRLGLFGVSIGRIEGTRRFIAESNEILRDARNLLVMTAQGRFADVRSRPAGLRNGVAHLLHAQPGRIAVPVALEYVFWN